jgi:membrane protein implicated in regulation of membrane protease activity
MGSKLKDRYTTKMFLVVTYIEGERGYVIVEGFLRRADAETFSKVIPNSSIVKVIGTRPNSNLTT